MNVRALGLLPVWMVLFLLLLSYSAFAWEGSYYPVSYYTTQGLMGNRDYRNSEYNHREKRHYRPHSERKYYVQRYLDYEYQHFYQHSYPVLGVVFSRPFGSQKIIFHENEYYYNSGIFYKKCGREYDVVKAPIGAYVRNLPHKYETEVIGNREYFYSQGTYFRGVSRGYEVVDNPYEDEHRDDYN